MPKTFASLPGKYQFFSYAQFYQPLKKRLVAVPPLKPGGNKPILMDFEHQLKALTFFHLEEHKSGRHLLQDLQENEFACKEIAPPQGIKKSTFFEAINHRGLDEMLYLFHQLYADAAHALPKEHAQWGELVAIDGTLIDAVLSMYWADYNSSVKKAKAHFGFNLNQSIPAKIILTKGKAGERPLVDQILAPGQTSVTDRGYQCCRTFDILHNAGKFFVCRIKENSQKTILNHIPFKPGGLVFQDSMIILGDPIKLHAEHAYRLVGYFVGAKKFWLLTNRFDLSAEDIAAIYKLRWNIENFFAWWKRHLKVYHLIARTQYGLMTQILAGLITYLLLAIYCHNEFNEKVSIKRVRQLRNRIKNEASFNGNSQHSNSQHLKPDRPNNFCGCYLHAIS